jgi:hypothetical protein
MTRFFISSIYIFVLVLVSGAANISAQESSIEDQLKQRADNFNAKLPIRVDDVTIWERTVAGPGKRFSSFYKMIDFVADTDKKRDAFVKNIRPLDVKAYCAGMKSLTSNDVPMSFQYVDKDGRPIADIVVTPKDCN